MRLLPEGLNLIGKSWYLQKISPERMLDNFTSFHPYWYTGHQQREACSVLLSAVWDLQAFCRGLDKMSPSPLHYSFFPLRHLMDSIRVGCLHFKAGVQGERGITMEFVAVGSPF